MYIEAFTASKDPRRPEANEDRLVIMPGVAYAVIDGVTDKSGHLYGGRAGGRLAGEIIEHAIRDLVAQKRFMHMPLPEIAAAINEHFIEAYHHHGIEAQVRDDPNARFAAQLALVLCDEESFRFVLIGDCGLRLDGETVHLLQHPGDGITAAMRAMIYHAIDDQGNDDAERLRAARNYALNGMAAFLPRHGAQIDERKWSELRKYMLAVLPERHPDVPRPDIVGVIDGGIKDLARHRNATSAMEFASLDGTDVPTKLLRDFTLPRPSVHTIELFSDGYFVVPEGSTVPQWEAGFHRLEQEDPAKVNSVLSTKGSGSGVFTDDRTVLIIRREPPPYA